MPRIRPTRREVLLGSAAAAGTLGWPAVSVRAALPAPEHHPQLIEAARAEGKVICVHVRRPAGGRGRCQSFEAKLRDRRAHRAKWRQAFSSASARSGQATSPPATGAQLGRGPLHRVEARGCPHAVRAEDVAKHSRPSTGMRTACSPHGGCGCAASPTTPSCEARRGAEGLRRSARSNGWASSSRHIPATAARC